MESPDRVRYCSVVMIGAPFLHDVLVLYRSARQNASCCTACIFLLEWQKSEGTRMIEILQETKTSVVCVKPVGIAAQGTDPQALPQLLAAQLGCEVYPVHRLDQAVGGVMVYAKTAKEAARLTQSMGEGGMQKTYLAVLTGCPEVFYGIGFATQQEIDEINILQATFLAMHRAYGELLQKLPELRKLP